MNDKVIIKGNFSKSNFIAIVFFALAAVSLIFATILGALMHSHEDFVDTYIAPSSGEGSAVLFYLFILFLILGILMIIRMNFCEITVTATRIYGKTAFGKRVDLPLDMVSSIGTSFPKGISISTSSGFIKFWLLNNQQDVYHAIIELLQSRQSQTSATIPQPTSNTEELLELKKLLDQGIITQDEFDAKKKQLLGL